MENHCVLKTLHVTMRIRVKPDITQDLTACEFIVFLLAHCILMQYVSLVPIPHSTSSASEAMDVALEVVHVSAVVLDHVNMRVKAQYQSLVKNALKVLQRAWMPRRDLNVPHLLLKIGIRILLPGAVH